MGWKHGMFGAILGAAVVAGPVAAQDHPVTIMARGGGFTSSVQVDNATTTQFEMGWNFGAGAAVELTPTLWLRGDASLAKSQLNFEGAATGTYLDFLVLDAALEYRYPTDSGANVYAYGGAGISRVKETGTSETSKSKPTGVLGAGVDLPVADSPFAINLEATGWLYKLNGMAGRLASFDKTQFDVAWGGGLSYHF